MPEDDDLKTDEFEVPGSDAGVPPRTAAPPVRADFAATSHPGRVRPNNEDHYLVVRMGRSLGILTTNLPAQGLPEFGEEVGYVMAVADGMGGLAAGERASMLALVSGLQLVLRSAEWHVRIDEQASRVLVEQMRQYFRQVDRMLVAEAEADRSLAGMGTTLTVAYSVGADAFIAHAGDSRAYLYRAGLLHQLTHDHTVAQSLADAGAIRPEEVHTHARRHVLTNYLGGPPFGLQPECVTLRLAHGDRLLLCSDGLTEMVDDPAIAAALGHHPEPEAACHALVGLALERGGRDNVTVALARYAIADAAP